MHYVIVGNGVCGDGGGARPSAARRGGPHQPRLRRARSLLLPARAHVRLRGPDPAPGHGALRPRALREDGVRAGARAGRDARRRRAAPWSSKTADGSATTSCCWRWAPRPGPRPGREPQGPGLHYFVTLRDLEGLDREATSGRARGGDRRRPHRRRGRRDPSRSRPPRHLPDPRELVLPSRPRRQGVGPRRGAHARARRRRPPRHQRRGDPAQCATARPRAVQVDGAELPCRARGRLDRRGAQHRIPRGRASPLSKGGAIEVDDALQDRAPRRLGRGRLRQRHLGRRLAPARAALVHRARPGPHGRRCPCWATRSPTAAAPGTTRRSSSTSSGRPRASCPRCSNFDNTPLDPGPDVRTWFQRVPGKLVSQKIVVQGRARGRLQHAGLPLGPRASPRMDPRAPQPRLGAGAPARGAVRRGVHAALPGAIATLRARGLGFGGLDASRPHEHVPAPASRTGSRWPGSARRCWSWPTSSCTSAAIPTAVSRPTPSSGSPRASPAGSRCRRPSTASGCSTAPATPWPWSSGGCFVLKRHGNSRYQRVRTSVVVLVQVVLAFALPLVHEGLRRPRALLLVLLAAQDRVPLPELHPAAAVPDPGLVASSGSLVAFPAARLLLRQALLLLVDLRLRRPRQHRGRALAASLRQVADGLAHREGLDLLGALPLARGDRDRLGELGASASSIPTSPASPSRCRTATASPSARCSRASSASASTRSWARASGAASAAPWRRCSASSRSSAASASP